MGACPIRSWGCRCEPRPRDLRPHPHPRPPLPRGRGARLREERRCGRQRHDRPHGCRLTPEPPLPLRPAACGAPWRLRTRPHAGCAGLRHVRRLRLIGATRANTRARSSKLVSPRVEISIDSVMTPGNGMQPSLSTTSRRLLVLCSSIVAAVLLILAGARLIEEELALRDLRSSDDAARRSAAVKLGRLRSTRAVPALVEIAEVVMEKRTSMHEYHAEQALLRIGAPAVPALYEELGKGGARALDWGRLIDRFQPEAFRAFLTAARDPRSEVSRHSLYWLGKAARRYPEALAQLSAAVTATEDDVRMAAGASPPGDFGSAGDGGHRGRLRGRGADQDRSRHGGLSR